RAVRGTPAFLPEERATRELYLLSEAAAIDRTIVSEVPGLAPALRRERGRALETRPPVERLTDAERVVEEWVRVVLQTSPGELPPPFEFAESPEGSLRWAMAMCRRLPADGPFRGLPAVALWGRVHPAPRAHGSGSADSPDDESMTPGADR